MATGPSQRKQGGGLRRDNGAACFYGGQRMDEDAIGEERKGEDVFRRALSSFFPVQLLQKTSQGAMRLTQ